MKDTFQQVRCDKGYARRNVTNKQARAKIKKILRKIEKKLLTNSKIYDIIKMSKGERKVKKL